MTRAVSDDKSPGVAQREAVESLASRLYDGVTVTEVIRPAAVLSESNARLVLAGLRADDVRSGRSVARRAWLLAPVRTSVEGQGRAVRGRGGPHRQHSGCLRHAHPLGDHHLPGDHHRGRIPNRLHRRQVVRRSPWPRQSDAAQLPAHRHASTAARVSLALIQPAVGPQSLTFGARPTRTDPRMPAQRRAATPSARRRLAPRRPSSLWRPRRRRASAQLP